MAQYNDAFGLLVSRALEEAEISDREAARRSRGAVSHYTIGQMRAGAVPAADLIVAFALAVGGDPNEFLDAAEKRTLRYVPQAGGRVRWGSVAGHEAWGVGAVG